MICFLGPPVITPPHVVVSVFGSLRVVSTYCRVLKGGVCSRGGVTREPKGFRLGRLGNLGFQWQIEFLGWDSGFACHPGDLQPSVLAFSA